MAAGAPRLPHLVDTPALFAEGSLTATELLRDALNRIDRHERALNAFITVDSEGARTQAEESDARRSIGRVRGPLDGCVIALKESIDVRGLSASEGSKVLRGRKAAIDAPVVSRLRQAGAVLIGKTHMHEFGLGATGENPHIGDSRNPWNRHRVSGGSSSGSAIAVAAGFAQAALGTDGGGSVRGPAAFCGVVGFKPTHGRIEVAGSGSVCGTLSDVGTLTVTVRDAALLLDACVASRFSGASEHVLSSPSRPRIVVPEGYFFHHLAPDVARVLAASTAALPDLGWDVTRMEWPDTELALTADAVGWTLLSAEAAASHEDWLLTQPDDYGPDVRNRLELGRGLLATEYLRAQRLRRMLQVEFGRVFAEADIVITPACPTTAFSHGTATLDLGGGSLPAANAVNRCLRIANLLGWPAITVPCGLGDDGLPVAVQLMAAPGDDVRLLQAAQEFESMLGRGPYYPSLS